MAEATPLSSVLEPRTSPEGETYPGVISQKIRVICAIRDCPATTEQELVGAIENGGFDAVEWVKELDGRTNPNKVTWAIQKRVEYLDGSQLSEPKFHLVKSSAVLAAEIRWYSKQIDPATKTLYTEAQIVKEMKGIGGSVTEEMVHSILSEEWNDIRTEVRMTLRFFCPEHREARNNVAEI